MFIFTVMAEVLGDMVTVWLVFIALMFAALVCGSLVGPFRGMRPASLIASFCVIGVAAVITGARFSETEYATLISLIVSLLMVISFICGALFAPERLVTESMVVDRDGHWNPAGGYFHGADDRKLREDCSNPVGRNVDTRA